VPQQTNAQLPSFCKYSLLKPLPPNNVLGATWTVDHQYRAEVLNTPVPGLADRKCSRWQREHPKFLDTAGATAPPCGCAVTLQQLARLRARAPLKYHTSEPSSLRPPTQAPKHTPVHAQTLGPLPRVPHRVLWA